MSILIKGMEMPKSCSVCFAREISGAGGGVSYCRLGGGALDFDYTERRMVFCPLVPVPPHGRLGDLDALMRHCVMLPRDGGSLPVVYASYVRNAPTIIPAEPPKDDSPAGTYDLLYEEGGPDA